MAGDHTQIAQARWPDDVAIVRPLFSEYVASLGVDIAFQGVDAELAGLPGKYAPPGGTVLIARVGEEPAGIVACRAFDTGRCEMKRLYVRPQFRGHDLGRRLAEHVIAAAREAGYSTMLLDTLETMDAARGLYGSLGFRPIEAYYDNPLPGVAYMALELRED